MVKLLRGYRDFSGGLSEVANDNIKDNQLSLALNTVPGERYGLARASGYNIAFAQIPDGEKVIEIMSLKPQAGGILILAFTPSKMYKLIPAAESSPESWLLLKDSLQPISDWFINGAKLYWLDGNNYWVYDGVSVAAVSYEPPSSGGSAEIFERIKKSAFVEQRGQRWFFSRRNYNEVIYSELGNPASFKTTSVFNISTKNSDTITALKEFADGLLIFKNQSVHYLSGWDIAAGSDIELKKLNVTAGTAFNRSVQIIENSCLYLGYNGVYQLYIPTFSLQIASRNIAEDLIGRKIEEFQAVNAYACVWNNNYYFSMENGAGEIREYRYYPESKSFWGEFTQNVTSYSVSLPRQGLYCGAGNGYILKANTYAYHYIDVATGGVRPIVMKARTKGYDIMDNMVQFSRVKKVFVVAKQFEAESSDIVFHLKADYMEKAFRIEFDESLVYAEGYFGKDYWGFVDTVTMEAPVNLKAKRVWFQISNNVLGQPVQIYGIGLLYKPKKSKGNREGVVEIKVTDHE